MDALLSQFIQPTLRSPSLWSILAILFLFGFYLNYKALSRYKESPESFDQAIAWLRRDKFGEFYRQLLGWLLDKVSDWIGDKKKARVILNADKSPELSPHNRFFSVNPFSHQSYDVLLRLAYIYSFLSFFTGWVMGGDSSISGMSFIRGLNDTPKELRWQIFMLAFILPTVLIYGLLKRSKKAQFFISILLSVFTFIVDFNVYSVFFWIAFIMILFSCYEGRWLSTEIITKDWKSSDQWVYSFAFGTIAAAAFVAAGAAGATAVLAASGIIIAFDGAIDIGGIATGSVLVATSVLIFLVIDILKEHCRKKIYTTLAFWLAYHIFLTIFAFFIIESIPFEGRLFLLFYLVFPLFNAPLDWLSLNITRGLLQSIRHQHHGGWQALLWVLFDLILALLFLLMVSAVLVLTMGFSDWLTGDAYLTIILTEMTQPETAKNYFWIYPMLLTTLVPTLVHFSLAGSAWVLWLPHDWRHRIADNLQNNHYKLWAASAYLTITPLIGLFAPIILLCGLYQFLIANEGWLRNLLLQWANMLAAVF